MDTTENPISATADDQTVAEPLVGQTWMEHPGTPQHSCLTG